MNQETNLGVSTSAAESGGFPPACDHAPLPWRMEELRNGKGRVLDARGKTVLHCPEACSPRDLGNLALIVRAVNVGQPEVSAAGIVVRDFPTGKKGGA